MALAVSSLPFPYTSSPSQPHHLVTHKTQIICGLQSDGQGRRVWRRRKLTKDDGLSRYKTQRVPSLEEQMRKVRETGKLMHGDIERLLLSEDIRYDFVNEIAAETTEYVKSNKDEYGGKKKALLHVISNRMNDAGFPRPDAYAEEDPYKPGPTYLKEEFT